MDRVSELRNVGVVINNKQEWRGEVGTPERKPHDLPNTVENILLPFSSDEWCSIAMRENENYVGGCCGQMSALQDLINGVFRDSGYVSNADFLRICELAEGHDGFEEYAPMNDEDFAKYISTWGQLDPWMKIGVIYNGVRPMLEPRRFETPSVDKERDDDYEGSRMIRRLGSTLSQIEWGDLYTRDDPKHREQYELTRQVNVARLVDPVRKLNEILEGMDEALDVFAIVELGTDEVMSNGLGLCLYKNREDAEHVVELWRKQAGDDEPANAEIKEARVSSKSGLTIQSTDA